MCLLHTLELRKDKNPNFLTVEQYKKLYSEDEELFLKNNDKDLAINIFNGLKLENKYQSGGLGLEATCLHEYNLDLLRYLLTSKNRLKVLEYVYTNNIDFAFGGIFSWIIRPIVASVISGDYKREEVKEILELFFNAKLPLKKSIEVYNTSVNFDYTSYKSFVSFFKDVANFMYNRRKSTCHLNYIDLIDYTRDEINDVDTYWNKLYKIREEQNKEWEIKQKAKNIQPEPPAYDLNEQIEQDKKLKLIDEKKDEIKDEKKDEIKELQKEIKELQKEIKLIFGISVVIMSILTFL